MVAAPQRPALDTAREPLVHDIVASRTELVRDNEPEEPVVGRGARPVLDPAETRDAIEQLAVAREHARAVREQLG